MLTEKPVYKELARKIEAYHNSTKHNNQEWQEKHEKVIFKILQDYLPSGSGIDVGTDLDFEKSNKNKLVFVSSYHVMNPNGFYTHWIDFTVTVKPSLLFDFDILNFTTFFIQ